ncbi:hypothetical protein O3G_MSEX008708 [Manduca sexta]|uniref:Uncharacterized protein n=1 Tax=Manduca sexta TaxID=7130 RepID=A0A921ZAF6_MANSE|nr:hypothetical protein O3G_MSEX008708 [Manduca sexta]
MDFKLIFLCTLIVTFVSAYPSGDRKKRDIFDSIKHAWHEVVKTLSKAGHAVANVFRPTTQRSVIHEVVQSLGAAEHAVLYVFKPTTTERGVMENVAESTNSLSKIYVAEGMY